MKFYKALTIGITTGSLICSLAYAQDQTATTTQTADTSAISKMFKSFDTDGDGKLSDTEKASALAKATTRLKEEMEKNSELKARFLTNFDANKDGVLSDDELKTAMQSRSMGKGMKGRMMPNIDTDGDGKISETEKAAAQTQFTAKMKEDIEKNPEMKARLLEKFDADKDGALSDSELKTAAESRPARPEGMEKGGMRGQMQNIDTDGDGVISDTEKSAATTQMVTKMKTDLETNTEMKTRLIEKFDADKDGALSDSELKTAAESRPQRPPRGEGGPGMENQNLNNAANGDANMNRGGKGRGERGPRGGGMKGSWNK